jgi:hypothetical protein
MVKLISVKTSSDPDKKLDVTLELDSGVRKIIHIGAKGYSDFIESGGDEDKKRSYITRHKVNEDWTMSGIQTAGFWSRWLLWNKETLKESIDDVKKRFQI